MCIHTHTQKLSHIWIGHVTCAKLLLLIYVRMYAHTQKMSHVWVSLSPMDSLIEWVTAHIRMSHGTHTNESCHICECVMSHVYMSLCTNMNEWYRTYGWVMSRTRMNHVMNINESLLQNIVSFVGLFYKKRPTISWIDSLCNHAWIMSWISMSQVTQMHESCHKCEWVMSHIWISHVTHPDASCHTYEWVTSHVRISHVTFMNESCCTCEGVMSHT